MFNEDQDFLSELYTMYVIFFFFKFRPKEFEFQDAENYFVHSKGIFILS